MHVELPAPFFYILCITNTFVMGVGVLALTEAFSRRWISTRTENAVHIIVIVGMLTSFFVAILLLLKSIGSGGGVVRLFG